MPVTTSLVTYAKSLPIEDPSDSHYDLVSLIEDILQHARSNLKLNAVVVPVLQTFNILIEGEAVDRVLKSPRGVIRCGIEPISILIGANNWNSLKDLIQLATRNLARLKSVERVLESMKL